MARPEKVIKAEVSEGVKNKVQEMQTLLRKTQREVLVKSVNFFMTQ
jgi:hypothetical protein